MYSSVCLTFFFLRIFRPLFQSWFIWIKHISAPQPIFPYSTWSCLLYKISTPGLQNLAMWKPFTCISYSRVSSVWTPHDSQMAACDFFLRSHWHLPVYGHFSSFHCVFISIHGCTPHSNYQQIWCAFLEVRLHVCFMSNKTVYHSKHLCFQTNGHGSVAGDLVYQERLSRLESDKECLVLQVCCQNQVERLYGPYGIFLSDLKLRTAAFLLAVSLNTAIVVSKCHANSINMHSYSLDKCSDWPGGSSRRKDKGPRLEPWGTPHETECYRRVIAAGVLFYNLMSSNKFAQHLSHNIVGMVSIKEIHFPEN